MFIIQKDSAEIKTSNKTHTNIWIRQHKYFLLKSKVEKAKDYLIGLNLVFFIVILSLLKHKRKRNFSNVSDLWSCVAWMFLGVTFITVSYRLRTIFIWRRSEMVMKRSVTFIQAVRNGWAPRKVQGTFLFTLQ